MSAETCPMPGTKRELVQHLAQHYPGREEMLARMRKKELLAIYYYLRRKEATDA